MKMLLSNEYWFGPRTTITSQKRRRHLEIFCVRFLWRRGDPSRKKKPSSHLVVFWIDPTAISYDFVQIISDNEVNQTVWLENLYRDSTLVWGLGSRTKAWVVVLHSVSWDPHNNNQGWKEDSLRNSLRSLGLASKSPAAAAAKTSFSCSYLWNGTFQRRGQQQAKSLVNMNFSNYGRQNSLKMGFVWFLWVF